MDNEKKVLLIAMPWALQNIPSIQLGLLSAYLEEHQIMVDSKHYYLKLAQKLGVSLYDGLARALEASILYSEILYDKEWTAKDYYDLYPNTSYQYEEVLYKLREFEDEILAELQLAEYDVIGFTIGYKQEIPSLSLAKRIKELHPDKLIVFGGSSCYYKLGENLIRYNAVIDIVVDGEGEEALVEVIKTYRTGKSFANVQGIYYRSGDEVIRNEQRPLKKNLDDNPIPIFDAYFQQFREYFQSEPVMHNISIPIEGSRGCWWNKCGFCGLNREFANNSKERHFRSRSVESIANEIEYQKDRYRIQTFSFLDNVHFKLKALSEAVRLKPADYYFQRECRAEISVEDIWAMRQMGFQGIQIGIESFSQGILQKMNKGSRVIQNINALKWCKIFGIQVYYNIIKCFPTETPVDVEEGVIVMKKLLHLNPPSRINQFLLIYASPVYQDYLNYNIKELKVYDSYKYIYPEDLLSKLTLPLHDYELIDELKTGALWTQVSELLQYWHVCEKNQNRTLIYVDGGTFLKITDTRYKLKHVWVLEEQERKLYLYCSVIRSWDEIKNEFPLAGSEFLYDTLNSMVEQNIMFVEDKKYLALALPHGEYSMREINKLVES